MGFCSAGRDSAGTFNNVLITVRDAAGATGSGTFSITINSLPTLGTPAPTQWTVNQPNYPGSIAISNGTGPLTISAQLVFLDTSNYPLGNLKFSFPPEVLAG